MGAGFALESVEVQARMAAGESSRTAKAEKRSMRISNND
jgi:hypothetical protein